MPGDLYITGDDDGDELLNTDGTALMIGMLLDQQVPLEWAFAGPATLRTRLGRLDASTIAALDEATLVAVSCTKPAIHRFPASMARRVHALCTVLVERYDGAAENLWADGPSGRELAIRLRALPGFGDEKTKIFIALWPNGGASVRKGGNELPTYSPTISHARSPIAPTGRRSTRCGSGSASRRRPSATNRIARCDQLAGLATTAL